MSKFPEAEARLFKNKFVNRKSKQVRKGDTMKVLAGKITDRKTGSHAFRPKRKK